MQRLECVVKVAIRDGPEEDAGWQAESLMWVQTATQESDLEDPL